MAAIHIDSTGGVSVKLDELVNAQKIAAANDEKPADDDVVSISSAQPAAGKQPTVVALTQTARLTSEYIVIRCVDVKKARDAAKLGRRAMADIMKNQSVQFVRKATKDDSAGWVEVVFDDSQPIDAELDTYWCEQLIDVHPTLSDCERFFILPKKGHIGLVIKTFEDYVATYCGFHRIERDETPYGFLRSLMPHMRCDMVGEERGKECCAVGVGNLDYLELGDFDEAMGAVVKFINETVDPYKSAPMLVIEDGQAVLSQALVDAAYGKSWSEASSRSTFPTEGLSNKQTVYVKALGVGRFDYGVGSDVHVCMSQILDGLDFGGLIPNHKGLDGTGWVRLLVETNAASSLEVERRLKTAAANSPLRFEPGESSVDVSMEIHFLLDERLIEGYGEGGDAQAGSAAVAKCKALEQAVAQSVQEAAAARASQQEMMAELAAQQQAAAAQQLAAVNALANAAQDTDTRIQRLSEAQNAATDETKRLAAEAAQAVNALAEQQQVAAAAAASQVETAQQEICKLAEAQRESSAAHAEQQAALARAQEGQAKAQQAADERAGSLAAHIEALLKMQLSRSGLALEGSAEAATITMTPSPTKPGPEPSA